MKTRLNSILLFALMLNCGGAVVSTPEPIDSELDGPTVPGEESPEPPEESPEPPERLQAVETLLEERGFSGAFVVARAGAAGPALLAANLELATTPHHPCSTFKIPNTIIGLETGIIPDASFSLAWDGRERSITAWNRDHTLPTALEHSVVWYYQEIARRVGHERMSQWVTRLEFGNQAIGGPELVDSFWLDGPLEISPLEQVQFLTRLTAGELPVTERSLGILREAMPRREHGEDRVLAKTGTCVDEATSHAWLVGWVEASSGDRSAHFALLLLGEDRPVRDLWQARWELALESLELAGVLSPSE